MIEITCTKKLHSTEGPFLLDISIQIAEGSFVSVYGKSGAGKTTLLKMLAGITDPDGGTITVNNVVWFDSTKRLNVIPQKRTIGFVFQDYALFPNMTVAENLEFVLPDKKEIKAVNEVLDTMGIGGLSARYPSTLSGGQQQRVAIARALVRKPRLLLLDEPLSSLDHETRLQLQEVIGTIHRQFNLTTILISHDPFEIYRLSDKIIELKFGKLVKQGTPSEVFQEKQITGKFQVPGTIIDIQPSDIVLLVKVISGNAILKVIVTKEEALNLTIGDQVMVTSKAFNPVLLKI